MTIGQHIHGARRRFFWWRVRRGWARNPITDYLGHSFVYPADSIIGAEIANGGEWDAALRPIVSTILTEDSPLICEVGSNLGASLLQILKAKPHARVISFEPSNRYRPLLIRNLRNAGFKQVEVYPFLVGRTRGKSWLYNNATTASVVSADYDGHQPRGRQFTNMTTLDDVFSNGGRVDFIKVDTDGFDFEVLRGGEGTLMRDQPAIFFELEAHLLENARKDLVWLQGLGYRRFICLDYFGKLVGVTTDLDQAIVWTDNPRKYCDVLVCADGSSYDTRLRNLDLSGVLGLSALLVADIPTHIDVSQEETQLIADSEETVV